MTSIGENMNMRDFTRTACDVGFANHLERNRCVKSVFLADLRDLSINSFPNHFGKVERTNRQGLMPNGAARNGEAERSGARCHGIPPNEDDTLRARREGEKASTSRSKDGTQVIQRGMP